jgi:hypothetical protein
VNSFSKNPFIEFVKQSNDVKDCALPVSQWDAIDTANPFVHYNINFTWNPECAGSVYIPAGDLFNAGRLLKSESLMKVKSGEAYSHPRFPTIVIDNVFMFIPTRTLHKEKCKKQIPCFDTDGNFVCTVPVFKTNLGCSSCFERKKCKCPSYLTVAKLKPTAKKNATHVWCTKFLNDLVENPINLASKKIFPPRITKLNGEQYDWFPEQGKEEEDEDGLQWEEVSQSPPQTFSDILTSIHQGDGEDASDEVIDIVENDNAKPKLSEANKGTSNPFVRKVTFKGNRDNVIEIEEQEKPVEGENWLFASARDFISETIFGSLLDFFQKKKEKLVNFLGGDTESPMRFIVALAPELIEQALKYAKEHPSQLGAAAAFMIVLVKVKTLYEHAVRYYRQSPVNQKDTLINVFPLEGVLGAIALSPIACIIGALGLHGVWQRTMENKDVEKSSFLELLGGLAKGTTTFVAVTGALMSAINLAAFSSAKNPSKNFVTSNRDMTHKLNSIPPRVKPEVQHHAYSFGVIEPQLPPRQSRFGNQPMFHDVKPMRQERSKRRRKRKNKVAEKVAPQVPKQPTVVKRQQKGPVERPCAVCKKLFLPAQPRHERCVECNKKGLIPKAITVTKNCATCGEKFEPRSKSHTKCKSCFQKPKIEQHGRRRKKKRHYNDYDNLNNLDVYVDRARKNEIRTFQEEDEPFVRPRSKGAHQWEDYSDWENDVDMSNKIEWNSKKTSKVCDNKDIEYHAKIPVHSISANVVKVGTEMETVGYAYLVSPSLFVCPSHYKYVEFVWRARQKFPCQLVQEFKDPSGAEGILLYEFKGTLPVNKIAMATPPSEFAGIIIAPGFSQISSCQHIDNSLIAYIAESTFGDCGQPVIDTEKGTVVGFHIGVNKSARVSHFAYAVALSPILLRNLNNKVKELGF